MIGDKSLLMNAPEVPANGARVRRRSGRGEACGRRDYGRSNG